MNVEIVISPTNPEFESLSANVYFQNAIKGDKGDQGERGEKGERGEIGDVYFATFSYDQTDGNLYMNTPEHELNVDFRIVDGSLVVEV